MIERDPVVLVHYGDQTVTGFLLPLLARRGAVLQLNLGTLQDDDVAADALRALLDEIRTPQVTLLGAGTAASVVIDVAVRRSEVATLVLIPDGTPVRHDPIPRVAAKTLVVGRAGAQASADRLGSFANLSVAVTGGAVTGAAATGTALATRPAEVIAAIDAFLDERRAGATGTGRPQPRNPARASAASAELPASEHADVVIVGAGFAGLGTGIRLAREGTHSFLILERGDDVGGTWRDNTYPGVACDIPSHLYSFSFRQKPDWSRFFSPGAEIQEYLRECAREEGLLPRIRLGTDALDLRWDDDAELWRITTNRGTVTATTLVMAAGRLSDARLPDLDGLADFTGRSFHSSAWDHEADLDGARVGLVGTGASAVQMLPHIAARASEVVLFQRTPAYVLPRDDRAYSPAQRTAFAEDPDLLDESRSELFWQAELGFPPRLIEVGAEALTARAAAHREAQVTDPRVREQLRPEYAIGCKRALFSNEFYPAIMLDHVTLESSPLQSVHGASAVSADGNRFELDMLIFATGFESTRPPFASRVTGRDGKTLDAHWSGGMTAYASTVVHGFPNFFVVDGPNASLGHNSAIYMIEAQIDYILGALAHQDAHGGAALEVTAAAERAYTAEIDRLSADTVWTAGGCTSWYLDDRSGRLTLLWPDFAHRFRQVNGTFDPAPFAAARRSDRAQPGIGHTRAARPRSPVSGVS